MSATHYARDIAHDLRHLLCTIRLTAEALEGLEDDAISHKARRILRAVDTGTDICGGLIEGRPRCAPAICVETLLGRVVDQLPSATDVEVRTDCTRGLTARLNETDALRCVYNLALNALAATASRAGGLVVLRARTLDTRLILSVEDNGPGFGRSVPQAALPHAPKSAGLGLKIANELAIRMGGTLRRSDAAVRGTIFRLILPASDHPDPGAAAAEQTRAS